MSATAELPIVSRFEADLLTILQGLLGHGHPAHLLQLLGQTRERPRCLSRACVKLVEDTLAKGATLALARQAWPQERFLRGDRAVIGRLWQRTAPADLGLTFSAQSLSFLIWATATEAGKRGDAWKPTAPLELGDRWFLCTAYAAVHRSKVGELWAERQPWRADAFCRLCFATDFNAPAAVEPDSTPWLTPGGIGILEASQHDLAERWIAMEQAKSLLGTIQELRAAATAQAHILDAYLAAIDRAGRRDLARFLLIAGVRLFPAGPAPATWQADDALKSLRLAERQQAYRDAQVVARKFEQLEQWQTQARHVGYFDEGYQAAQLWKLDWEVYNAEATSAAARQQIQQTQWL